MRLLLRLLLGIAAVVAVCLAATTAVILHDTHARLETATASSADRAARALGALYWQELVWRDGLNRAELLPLPEWRTLATARVVAPGLCVTFAPKVTANAADPLPPLCSLAEDDFAPAPAWFGTLYRQLYGAFPLARRPIDARQNVGEIVATADPGTALRLAWLEIALLLRTTALMALAIGLGVALLVVRALMPVRAIIARLRRLEAGDYAESLGRRGGAELGQIARAVDALAGRLARTQAARAALTRQLFQVQEDERRALARDLHDEFGQCLAATSALAGSIEAGAADRPDLAADARAIASAARRMMRTLQEALVRLRSQDIDELGLAACLRQLAASRTGADVRLETAGDLAAVPRPIAVGLYRIAQECLTNATRHGTARHVVVRIAAGADEMVSLSVEDDGGGDPARLAAGAGHGVLGIRERIAALGGSLAIGPAQRGIRVAATIPFARTAAGAPVPA